MRSAKCVGRVIGILLFLQLVGFIVPFVLLRPLTVGPSEFLANGAGASFQIKIAVFHLLANCALTIGISIAASPILRQYSYSMPLLLVAVSVIMFVLQAVDNVYLLSMLSLSQQSALAGGPNELFHTLAAAVGSTRKWAHYSELLVIDAWIFLFYALLYRFALVPRALAGFGLMTVMLHFTGMLLPVFLGYGSVTLMGASMGLGHLALVLWLVARGFGEPFLPAVAGVLPLEGRA